MPFWKSGVLFCCLISLAFSTKAQVAVDSVKLHDSVTLFTVKGIIVSGNKHTKRQIVLRELSFKEDERYPLNVLVDKFNESKKQLLSTELFYDAVIALKNFEDHDVNIQVNVKERWYIFPLPFFKLADRNFAEWRRNGMSLNRVNYGVDITHKNFTGRNDQLNIYLMTGFTHQVRLGYRNLFLDKALKWSDNFSFAYGKTKEIGYQTINNLVATYKNTDSFAQTFSRTSIELNYRPALKTRHTFGFAYNYLAAADTVFKLNPKFTNTTSSFTYPELYYRFNYTDLDYYPYPKSGIIGEAVFSQKGFNRESHFAALTLKTSQYIPINESYFFNLRLMGHIKFPFDQPYLFRRFLPVEGYMQGFEGNVLDGVAGGYAKTILTRQIFNRTYSIPSKKIDLPNNIPVHVYAKVFGNTGYVYDNQPTVGTYSNKWLFSAGVGLDIVVFYDWIFKIEYSFASIGQKGLFLHTRDFY